jgi:two-component system, NtrC family, sensor histidine kinase HydH
MRLAAFSLSRYFAVASMLVIATIAGVTAWLFSSNLERNLVEEAAAYARDISHTLNRAIYAHVPLPRGGEAPEGLRLRDPEQLRALDALVRERMSGLRILTVNLFDRSGTVLYSTKSGYIGYRSRANPGIDAALAERAATFLKRFELEQREHLEPAHDLLETYTPFYEIDPTSGSPGRLVAVLELYQDARPITNKIAEGRREVVAITGALMGVLFLALFAIVRRGDLRIRQLTDAIEYSNRQLQESLASLGSMAAGVAHEIRNPIGIITSSAQLLGQTASLAPRDRELLGVLRDESARVERTVSEFVRFATPPRPNPTATHPAELLARVQSSLSPEAEQRGVALALELDADLPAITVDGELLHRALVNLALNALQVQSRGGSVRIEARHAPDKSVQICVCDRGPGIAEEDLDRVFQPFFSRRPGGTGLGLSIVQRIVTACGGRIAVTSGARGTRFALVFPATPA